MKTFFAVLCLLSSVLWVSGQQIKISRLPRTNIVHGADLLIIDSHISSTNNYTTRGTALTNIINFLGTNILGGFIPLTNGDGYATTLHTPTFDGIAYLEGYLAVPGSSNFLMMLGANNIMTNVTLGSGLGLSGTTLNAQQTPGVTNLPSAATIVIDLALTNTPIWAVTNPAAHNISLIVSNPAPGRWFSFYADGSGVITNNALAWTAVAGTFMKWLDATTNTTVVSNGFVSASGFIPTATHKTNLVITYRDE